MAKKNNMKKSELNSLYKKIGVLFCIGIFLLTIIGIIIKTESIITDERTYDIILKSEYRTAEDPFVEKEWDIKSDLFLRPLLSIMEYEKAIIFLLFITVIATLLFAYNIVKNHIFFFILGISPFFIRMSSNYSDYSILLIVLACFGYLWKKQYYFLGFLSYVIIAWLNSYIALFILALIIYQKIRKQPSISTRQKVNEPKSYKKLKTIYPILFSAVFVLISVLINGIKLSNTFIEPKNIFQRIIYDFGAVSGIPVVLALLGIIGLIVIWHKEKSIKIMFFFAVAICFINLESGLFLLNILSIYLASYLVNILITEKWHNEQLKQISIMLIFCSILFSGISYANAIALKQNNQDLIDAITWINQETSEDSVIFTHYNYGYSIKFIGNRKIILDANLHLIKNATQKFNDSNQLFQSRNIEKTIGLIEKYNINYILITNEMKQGLVWNKENEGLLFLMNAYPEFNLVLSNNQIRIWQYTP